MKFTFALLGATAAALLNHEKPFDELPVEDYEQLITVDPKIAPGTARPDCKDGKCHLKNAAGADKIFLAVDYSDKVDGAYIKGGKPDFQAYLETHGVDGPPKETLHGYAGINLIVKKEGTAGLLALVQGFPDNKHILTIQYADYKTLTEEALKETFSLKDKLHRLFVFYSADIPQAPETTQEPKITWIVKTDAEGQALLNKGYQAANIVTLDGSDYAINDVGSNLDICPSKQ